MSRRGGRGGRYDRRKHVRASEDSVVQTEVRASIQRFIDDPNKPREYVIQEHLSSETSNTYKQFCRQLKVGWARGATRGQWKMIRFLGADPACVLWKKVWCFYFMHYCDADLIAQSKVEPASDEKKTPAMSGLSLLEDMDESDLEEATEIRRLKAANNDDDNDDDDVYQSNDCHTVILDSTSNSLDGKRKWTKVRDFLMEIKHSDNRQLWEECCSLGINNCSEKKLESHLDNVEKFFDLQGRGPNQKIRGKKLLIEVGRDESVHFVGDTNLSLIHI